MNNKKKMPLTEVEMREIGTEYHKKKFEKGLTDPKGFTELKTRIDKYFGLSFEVEEAFLKDTQHAKLIAKSPTGKIIIELEVSIYPDSQMGGDKWHVGGVTHAISNYHWHDLTTIKKEEK